MSLKLRQLDDNYLDCQGLFRHRWSSTADDGQRNRKYQTTRSVVRVALSCTRCYARKDCVINRLTGEKVINPTYRYPKNYSLAGEQLKLKDKVREYLLREARRNA